jgi:uncharacterized membrane protein
VSEGGSDEPAMPDRILLFSDAVVAIAITLLAIALPVPQGGTSHLFWSSVRHNQGHYLAFLTSFLIISVAWSQHRRVWGSAARADHRMQTINMLWLLTIILVPFATQVLRPNGPQSLTTHAYRFGFYALVEVVSNTAILLIARRIVSQQLYRPGVVTADVVASYWPCYGVIVGFGLSIPIFFATRFGWVLWIVGPVLVAQVGRRRRSA